MKIPLGIEALFRAAKNTHGLSKHIKAVISISSSDLVALLFFSCAKEYLKQLVEPNEWQLCSQAEMNYCHIYGERMVSCKHRYHEEEREYVNVDCDSLRLRQAYRWYFLSLTFFHEKYHTEN